LPLFATLARQTRFRLQLWQGKGGKMNKEILSFEILSKKEVKNLFLRVKNGDNEARGKIICIIGLIFCPRIFLAMDAWG